MEYFEPYSYGLQNSGKPWSYNATGSDARFEVRAGDRWATDASDKERSEIVSYKKLNFGETYNISYKMMIEPGAANTAGWMLVGQVHQSEDPKDLPISPPFAIQMVGEKIQVVGRAVAAATTIAWPTNNVLYTSPTDIVRGDWYQFDLKIKFGPAGGGLVDLNINGVKVVSYVGALGYNDAVGGYWKEGIYRDPSSETIAVHFADMSFVAASDPVNTAVIGGNGNDFLGGTKGADAFEGGNGNDSYDVNNVGDTVVELANGGIDLVTSNVNYALPANVENLTLSALGSVDGYGNGLANTLTGNESANLLSGLGGADVLKGNGGDDLLLGGDGNDYLQGGAGDDVIVGGAGADQVYGGAGADVFRFDSLGDFATALPLDIISDFSHAQSDQIDLSRIDANSLVAGNQAFTFIGNAPFHNQAGELAYQLGPGYVTVLGDVNGDGVADFQLRVYTTGLLATDFILGQSDPNPPVDIPPVVIPPVVTPPVVTPPDPPPASVAYTLAATVQNFTVTDAGPIDVYGNGLANALTGNESVNLLSGLSGADVLKGAGGNDLLLGGDGNDYIQGGAGDDVIIGGAGADQVYGGAGADIFRFNSLSDFATTLQLDIISDFSHAQSDQIDLSRVDANTLVAGAQAFTFIGNSAFHNQAGELAYQLGPGYVTVLGDVNGDGVADFQLRVYASSLTASDFILGTSTSPDPGGVVTPPPITPPDPPPSTTETYNLAADVSNFTVAGTGPVDVYGNSLANTLLGNEAANTLFGLAGADILKGAGGNDQLFGGAGNDYLQGGAGADLVVGGAGADQMYGGSGADVFRFDSISDFAVGVQLDRIDDFARADGDLIDLSQIDANSLTAGDQAFTFTGSGGFHNQAGELIYAPAAGYVTVMGDVNGDSVADFQLRVYSNSLSAADFIL